MSEPVKVTVRIPEDLRTDLRVAAAMQSIPMEQVVERAIRRELYGADMAPAKEAK